MRCGDPIDIVSKKIYKFLIKTKLSFKQNKLFKILYNLEIYYQEESVQQVYFVVVFKQLKIDRYFILFIS
jgi:hypothetical protein